jgi:hypothetical protein
VRGVAVQLEGLAADHLPDDPRGRTLSAAAATLRRQAPAVA